jgi:hypothetical protein
MGDVDVRALVTEEMVKAAQDAEVQYGVEHGGYTHRVPEVRMRAALEAVAGDFAAVARREVADFVRRRALTYPADVFPADSTSRDGIAGATLRDMLPRLADEIDRWEATP